MKVRYGLAAVFAAAIAAVLLLRHEGYLHGRVTPGPFRLYGGSQSAQLQPGQTKTFEFSARLAGDPVRVETVRPQFTSPRLEVLGPRSTLADCTGCPSRGWPPSQAGPPLRHHLVTQATTAGIFGLRATSRGVYYAHELNALYQRGAKSFASTLNRDWCITIGHGKQCARGYLPPKRSTIVEWGGPSRYGVPIRKAVGEDATTATYPLRAGTRTIALTLSNLTNISRTVGNLRGALADGVATISQPERSETTIPPHGGRRFLLQIGVPACQDAEPRTFILERLTADVNGRPATVPLSVALAFRSVSAC